MKASSLKIALVASLLTKVVLAGITPFSADFLGWVSLGGGVFFGQKYFGIYSGPAYIYAAPFALWVLTTKDAGFAGHLVDLFYLGPRVIDVSLLPRILAFTLTMKIPLIIADVAVVLLIMHIVHSASNSRWKALSAALLWTTSPLVFLLESWGGDIFPALLVLLGVYAIYRNRVAIGSGSLALGSIIRLGPLLLSCIYVVAFVRLRRMKELSIFVLVQLGLIVSALAYVFYIAGIEGILQLVGTRPGIIIPEILSAMGPFLRPGIAYNPYELGLAITAYLLIAYFFTKSSLWKERSIGTEALALFAAFYAFTEFLPQFLLWILPIFVVYATLTRFGAKRFLLTTTLGFFFVVFQTSRYVSGLGKAILFVPNLNEGMASISHVLYQLDSLPLIPGLFRSLFSASMLLVIFWLLTRHNNDDSIQQTRGPCVPHPPTKEDVGLSCKRDHVLSPLNTRRSQDV